MRTPAQKLEALMKRSAKKGAIVDVSGLGADGKGAVSIPLPSTARSTKWMPSVANAPPIVSSDAAGYVRAMDFMKEFTGKSYASFAKAFKDGKAHLNKEYNLAAGYERVGMEFVPAAKAERAVAKKTTKSPSRKSKSPAKKSKSPAKKSKSPAKKSKSPAKKATKSPARKTKSPAKKATKSPARKTKSPAKKATKSPARKTKSPAKKATKSPKAAKSPVKVTSSPRVMAAAPTPCNASTALSSSVKMITVNGAAVAPVTMLKGASVKVEYANGHTQEVAHFV